MRKLVYRQKIDAYQVMAPRLFLQDSEIHLEDPIKDCLEDYQKLADMAYSNSELEPFGIKEPADYQSLFNAVETGSDFNGLRFGAIDIKVCCISFGFYEPSSKDAYIPYEDRKYYWVKIPLSGTGKIFFGTMRERDERYSINWQDGYLAFFRENINGFYTEYSNLVSRNQHVPDANLSAFLVTEYTPM